MPDGESVLSSESPWPLPMTSVSGSCVSLSSVVVVVIADDGVDVDGDDSEEAVELVAAELGVVVGSAVPLLLLPPDSTSRLGALVVVGSLADVEFVAKVDVVVVVVFVGEFCARRLLAEAKLESSPDDSLEPFVAEESRPPLVPAASCAAFDDDLVPAADDFVPESCFVRIAGDNLAPPPLPTR